VDPEVDDRGVQLTVVALDLVDAVGRRSRNADRVAEVRQMAKRVRYVPGPDIPAKQVLRDD
jgi:hypothetical protein